jgi:hypothetical protein
VHKSYSYLYPYSYPYPYPYSYIPHTRYALTHEQHIISNISYIIYHISYIIYHISYIIYHISYIIYHISYTYMNSISTRYALNHEQLGSKRGLIFCLLVRGKRNAPWSLISVGEGCGGRRLMEIRWVCECVSV